MIFEKHSVNGFKRGFDWIPIPPILPVDKYFEDLVFSSICRGFERILIVSCLSTRIGLFKLTSEKPNESMFSII